MRPSAERFPALDQGTLERPGTPASVLACLEVCARCPVRIECLTDTVGERALSLTGTFGGTTTADRTAAVREAYRSYKRDLPAYADHLTDRDEREVRTRAAAALEASFAERLEDWRREAHHERPTVTAAAPRPARSTCRRCGSRLGWWRRSDARYCSPRCRQASYRVRVA